MLKAVAALFGAAILLSSGCRRPVARTEWTVMGTVAAVQSRDGGDLREAASVVRGVFARIEKLLNAHDPQSELNRLASRSDAEILAACSPEVRPCYRAAFALARRTDGVFNPRWRGSGTMDLGGIAKGFAVDVAARELAAKYPSRDLLVDLGGNLRAVGGTWEVAVAGSDRSVTLSDGDACATSGEYYRGKHIRDGRDGRTVSNAVYSVTAVVRARPDGTEDGMTAAMLADGLSTAFFILGPEKSRALAATCPSVEPVWVSCP